ncbi:MAG: Gfo/Idh/MocA family oxidoreductase [SAR202 cluster bacterium]|jgi:predicted dehydrogenase|nr:Gfo/Idh/MocA family oxidoreductase [SAR202 cluster bacterium]
MKLSICIVGCGGYARIVLDDIYDMKDEFDFYFASRDVDKARRYCQDYGGAGYFGDYEKAAADPKVESLYYFTPHDLHPDNVRQAAGHGKHVLMEKPIARTVQEASEMAGTAREAGIKLMIAENYRFLNTVDRAKEIMGAADSDNPIGDLRMIEMVVEGHGSPGEWRANLERNGGGVFIDGGIHFVDIVLNIAGFPEIVHAIQPPQLYPAVEGEDGILATATLPGGVACVINYSRSIPVEGQFQAIKLTGTRGRIAFDPRESEFTIDTPGGSSVVQVPAVRRGVRGMVSEFRRSIEEDREPVMSAHEGTKDLAFVLAAYESMRTGESVRPALPAL